MDKDEALYQYPNLKKEHLKGAVVYYDGQMNDARMNLSILLTSVQNEATAANYVDVVALLKDSQGKVCGATVEDRMTGKKWNIHAKAVINATGPFTGIYIYIYIYTNSRGLSILSDNWYITSLADREKRLSIYI